MIATHDTIQHQPTESCGWALIGVTTTTTTTTTTDCCMLRAFLCAYRGVLFASLVCMYGRCGVNAEKYNVINALLCVDGLRAPDSELLRTTPTSRLYIMRVV